jgi:hypothetical protein
LQVTEVRVRERHLPKNEKNCDDRGDADESGDHKRDEAPESGGQVRQIANIEVVHTICAGST